MVSSPGHLYRTLCRRGPLAGGWLYDLFGEYDLPFWLCSLGFLVAAGCILLTPRDPY